MNHLDSLEQLELNEKIYIYGSGSYAMTLYDQIHYYRKDLEIIGFLDKFKTEGFIKSKPIININFLDKIDNEVKIIVATDISFWDQISNDLNGYNYYLNRFHDFNIYRRKEGIHNTRRIKEFFLKTDQVKYMFEAIENKNIKHLINNEHIIQGQDEFLKKLRLKNSDNIINGGGGNGNENDFFLKKVGKNGKIFSFDPNHKEPSNIQQLQISPNVLYNKNTKIGFEYNGSRSRIVENCNNDNSLVDAITIDKFININNVDKVDCITLDVEGFEKKVLEGAEKCIKNHEPTLAISVYHSTADFFEIPSMLKEMCSKYIFDIGIYTQQGMDTILHAYID